MASTKKTASKVGALVRSKRFTEQAGPTLKVWLLADAMPGKRRGEVIAKAVELGINEATAKTQYQRWYSTKH